MSLSRRALLGSGAGLAAAGVLTGCGGSRAPSTTGATPPSPARGSRRIRYGEDRSQFVDLRLPRKDPTATVVLLHGGYWLPEYGLDLMQPLVTAFTGLGYATWNVEYRRTGQGGGFPATFTDVATALDRLAEEHLPGGMVLLGHSAGGHLAGWAASRSDRTPGGAPRVRPTGAISLSGLLDLTAAASAPESSGPVRGLMGGDPQQRSQQYAVADPTLLAPAACPVWAAQATEETVIPTDQAARYVRRARLAGGTATTVALEGDHFTLIDPRAPSFATIRRLVDRAAR